MKIIIELHKVLQKQKYIEIPVNEKIFISREIGHEVVKTLNESIQANTQNAALKKHSNLVKEQILAAFMIDENSENKGIKLSSNLELIKDLENDIRETINKEIELMAQEKDFSADKGAKEKAYQKILQMLNKNMPEPTLTADQLFEKIVKDIKIPPNYLERDYKSIGGMWTVDTWVKDDIKIQMMDEGYTLVISKIDDKGMHQWSVVKGATNELKFEKISEEEFKQKFSKNLINEKKFSFK